MSCARLVSVSRHARLEKSATEFKQFLGTGFRSYLAYDINFFVELLPGLRPFFV